jgi:hypothetical protein
MTMGHAVTMAVVAVVGVLIAFVVLHAIAGIFFFFVKVVVVIVLIAAVFWLLSRFRH